MSDARLSPLQASTRRAVLRALERLERGALRSEDAFGARELGSRATRRRRRPCFELYFAYCEAGFLERRIASAQLVLARPGSTRAPILGELRA